VNLFAATAVEFPKASRVPGLVASDIVMMIGLAALVFGALIAWIVFIRGPKKHPSEERKPLPPPSPMVTVTEDGLERHRKKRRTRRRDHRQRNPTLSQTGGLPPPRNPEESPTI
jgi:hypothetical protein